MRKNITAIALLFFVSFLISSKAANAAAADHVCGRSVEECRPKCVGGTSQQQYQSVYFYCTNGWVPGTAAIGIYCDNNAECVSSAYCETSGLNDRCAAKKANGAQCNDCVNECISKNSINRTTNAGVTSISVRYCADATGRDSSTSATTNQAPGTSGQFYRTESECKAACVGGNCAPSGVGSFVCTMPSSNAGSGSVNTQTGFNSAGSVNISNPLQFDTVEGFLGAILNAARQIIVVLALVFIVIGAIMYVISAGQSGMMETAKKTITMAMVGLAIGIAAPSFLKEISKILGWNSTDSAMAGALTLSQIALNVLNFLLGIFGTLAIIMLLIGGIMYLTSAGDQDRIDSGKKIFKYSVIGIVMALASLVIVQQIARFFA